MIFSISEEYRKQLEVVIRANDVTFSRLSRLAGLDPAVDFRYANLRDVDFRDSDLRGFDFTGSDLVGAIKDSSTIIDETTILLDTRLSWIEAESNSIVNKMMEIQSAQSSTTRQRLLSELQEQYRSANHIRQFLITSMRKANSVEAFFDFANSVHTTNDADINSVIREELGRIIDRKGFGSPTARRKVAKTPLGLDLIVKQLEESINPFLRSVAEKAFDGSRSVSRSIILEALRGTPTQLI